MADLAKLYSEHLDYVTDAIDRTLANSSFDGVAIYSGRSRLQFLDDSHYPFRANPHFKWWLPDSGHEECWIFYQPGSRPVLVFYQPDDYWYQPPEDPEGFWVGSFDIKTVRDSRFARDHLPADASRIAAIGEPGLLPEWAFGAVNPDALINPLHWRRGRKSEYEIECMRRATQVGVNAHLAAEKTFRAGGSEFEIQQAYLSAAAQTADEMPYSNIVGLNRHASVLHYQNLNRRAPETRYSFLIDAGANFGGYACDITRTYSANPGDEFDQMIQALDQRQRALCDGVRAGASYVDLHLMAHLKIAEVLSEFDLVALPGEDIVDTGITATFLPHGLGHLLGLQVHDVGGHQASEMGGAAPPPANHPYLRLTQTLEPGHVVTIEPGIYFIPSLLSELRSSDHGKYVQWDKVESFLNFGGIRIEDNVVVTQGDPLNLTREMFAAA